MKTNRSPYTKLNSILVTWKAKRPELKQVYSQVLQNVRLGLIWLSKRFSEESKPEKNQDILDSRAKVAMIASPTHNLVLRSDAGKLHLAKIGDIKIKLHRPIEGNIKTCTVRRSTTGKWFACFSVEMEDVPLPPWKDGSVVGIDVGLESFATLSNGEKIANPRFFRDEEKSIARVQRKLSKAPKGTSERKAAIRWSNESMRGLLTGETILPTKLVVSW